MAVEFITMVAALATLGVALWAVYLAWTTQKVLEETQEIINDLGLITSIKAGLEYGPAVLIGYRVAQRLQKEYEEGRVSDEDLKKMEDEVIQEAMSTAG